ncbi:MAG: very short patch repair endonuclease [Bifidobacteriales bacterium]|nr:very short patch repair endonuclease [Bifidobacteriales bacterium]
MADIVTPAVRSRMMSRIRGKNTKPELALRKALHAAGFRYRLHDRKLPGTPDIVLPRYGAVIMVHGCFWHGHDCALFRLPGERRSFWAEKIGRNRERDTEVRLALRAAGWRVCVVWECAMRGKGQQGLLAVVEQCGHWLRSNAGELEMEGRQS